MTIFRFFFIFQILHVSRVRQRKYVSYLLPVFIINIVSRSLLWTLTDRIIESLSVLWYTLWCSLQSKRLTRQSRILRQDSGGSDTGLTDHACRPCLMLDRDVCSRVYIGAARGARVPPGGAVYLVRLIWWITCLSKQNVKSRREIGDCISRYCWC